MKRIMILLLAVFIIAPATASKRKAKPRQKEPQLTTLQIIAKVNDHYQQTVSPQVRAFWDDAAYHTGNMEAYRLTGNARWLEYSDQWARHNKWQGATGNDHARWRTAYLRYGEGRDHVLFADWQICFQTYLDLNAVVPAPHKVARVREVIDFQIAQPQHDFWWWADALYMGSPVFTKLYKLTKDTRYLDAMTNYFQWSDSLMWDAEAKLYFRDGKYIWPKHKTDAGRKDFWARGNGWVLAALAKILQDIPSDYKYYPFFKERFLQLAEGVAKTQLSEGYWTRSMADPEQAPGYETSGTAFFCYGLLWGINTGLLDRTVYEPVANRAWHYLTTIALQADGSVGYVQPIGEKAIKGQQLTGKSMTNFGTGAFLLAACERVRYEGSNLETSENGKVVTVTVHNPTDDFRQQIIELDAQKVFQKLCINGGRQFRVLNAFNREIPSQLTYDGHLLLDVCVSPHNTAMLRIVRGRPVDVPASVYGRMYPERLDDITWENDLGIYRLYGPALQRRGERAYGNDVWVKNTPDLQSESRYYLHPVLSFHEDHGRGLDCYKVGPSLGCGTPALMQDNHLVFPYCYQNYELLDNGPLRFTISLTYGKTLHQGDSLAEHRLLSLDKGSNLNRQTVWYEGATDAIDVASGVVIHNEDMQHVMLGSNYVLYADPTDNLANNSQIFVGVLFPDGATETKQIENIGHKDGITAHALCIQRGVQPGERITYYWGASWSKYDCRTLDEWKQRMTTFQKVLQQPLEVMVQ